MQIESVSSGAIAGTTTSLISGSTLSSQTEHRSIGSEQDGSSQRTATLGIRSDLRGALRIDAQVRHSEAS